MARFKITYYNRDSDKDEIKEIFAESFHVEKITPDDMIVVESQIIGNQSFENTARTIYPRVDRLNITTQEDF